MDRRRPEIIATSGLKGLGLDLGEALDRLLDGSLNSVFGAEVGERLAKGTITLLAEADHPAAKPQIRDDFGRDGANGAEFAAFRRICWAPH